MNILHELLYLCNRKVNYGFIILKPIIIFYDFILGLKLISSEIEIFQFGIIFKIHVELIIVSQSIIFLSLSSTVSNSHRKSSFIIHFLRIPPFSYNTKWIMLMIACQNVIYKVPIRSLLLFHESRIIALRLILLLHLMFFVLQLFLLVLLQDSKFQIFQLKTRYFIYDNWK